ncbi:hypothetical protein ACJ73_04367 [Blastomyces percursus]|uniref:Uncharacterized protein n=1 Tax=Blastomyces percursus TaxID=1658174 RepID=A0A1J9QVL4_9EURO|nr:hypothetical protein ACJ73_04367 [Blastomyces percursus]
MALPGIESTSGKTLAISSVTAFLALSSCLGDSFRARIAGFSINPREAIYDRSYLRTMTNSGSAMSEQIELEDMLRDRAEGYYSDDAL